MCTSCPKGHYAPKIRDFGHFESMPEGFLSSCSVATEIGNHKDCSINKGWHTNTDLLLQSNTKSHGIPQGIKFSLKTYIGILNTHGGRMIVTFKL